MASTLKHVAPLKPGYIPRDIVDRDRQLSILDDTFTPVTGSPLRNFHVYGRRGTGKSLLLHQLREKLPDTIETCYVPCTRFNTEYKALQQIAGELKEDPGSGYHTSDLQRLLTEHLGDRSTLIVLDEIDFLLMNDGDSLLYFLSRLEHNSKTSIITVSPFFETLAGEIEERTHSSLHPEQLTFEPYNQDELREIVLNRADTALKPRSLHRDAADHLVNQYDNPAKILTWLHATAEAQPPRITKQVLDRHQEQGFEKYAEHLLQPFTDHHRTLFQAITDLTRDTEDLLTTGEVLEKYRQYCQAASTKPLTDRRISTYLKHLELLNLIKADYQYGGSTGKTREIQLLRNDS